MNAEQLRGVQAPLKSRYKEDPASAALTLSAEGTIAGDDVVCNVACWNGSVPSGLHPAAGGDGSAACAGDMLLQALVGCSGVTLKAVATAMNIPIRSARIRVEGDMDFRGTLGVNKEVPVGFTDIRLLISVDGDATPEQIDTLVKLTKRYCVVYQTLQTPAKMSVECKK